MKKQCFKIALKLSADELNEVIKVKEHLSRILEKDYFIKSVNAGFSFLEIEVHAHYTDCVYRTMQDGKTYVSTAVGLIQVANEVGSELINNIKEKQEKNEFINVNLLPL